MSKMRSSSSIQEISYQQAKEFIVRHKDLILKPDYKYFGLYVEDELVSILGLKEAKAIKIHCNYTPLEKRGKGYFSRLLLDVIEKYKGYKILADCLLASKNIYINNGFTLKEIKHYKSFDIYKVELDNL